MIRSHARWLTPLALLAACSASAQTITNGGSRATVGVGAMTAIPAGSTNGTLLACPTASGTRLYLPSGASVTYTVATTAPTAAPTATFTVSSTTTGANWDENLAFGAQVYVTAVTGSPLYRCY